MADGGPGFCFFWAVFFAYFFCVALSRSLIEIPKTTVLDVSASLQKTHNVLSFNPEAFQTLHPKEQTTTEPSLASLVLSIHPRHTLHKPTHTDYKTLTLARLKRDAARVRSLNTKVDLAVKGIKKSDLKPLLMENAVQPSSKDLEGPVISGMSQGSGEYFSRLGIGVPAKQLYMVIDTGSDVNWVQCAPCTDCYDQADPIYEPSSSSSYSPLSCDSEQCKSLDVSACRNGSCLYQVSYGDGSYTVGDFVTETITFGNSGAVNNIALGCGHDNEGLFIGAAGLIGLGGGSLSFPSQIKASSLSYCLVDRDSSSSSTLEFDAPEPSDAVTAPLLRNTQLDTFYYVGLTGISVGGELLSIPPSLFAVDESGNGGVIVDSGTAVTRLKTEAYNSLRDAFVKGTGDLPSTSGVALFDTCYDLSSKTSVEVPTVTFHFPGGKSLPLPAKNYLVPVDSQGTFCFAFAPTSSALSIIGNIQQQGTRVSVDFQKSVVGFSPSKC
ncbi:PREDICTED: protein ASPARTIC PROTEASE IN GUARD CELL 1 [Nelumbo nucifera]|uniref:Protein ASPARTIC PROTEASE IN GUARD CELL 1 n=1 Tax=Nelumbo nucifera TaxID=4432 RepID=A0A1U8AR65_NELNU|nr:PREDICTED: protein ASPARTIC PROTEASE IN GUARD CELL 1 [Nelumbo nucifera]